MSAEIWGRILAGLPNPHFMQTAQWAQVKAPVGWQAFYCVWSDRQFIANTELAALQTIEFTPRAACLVLKRRIPVGGFGARLAVLYAPKGPNLDWTDLALAQRVLTDLEGFARKQGGIFVKIDPDIVLGRGIPGSDADQTEPGGEAVRGLLQHRGWRFSDDQIQFRNTVYVSLKPSEEELLANMKQKTRYNVRLGPKKGVVMRVGGEQDWPMLYKMYAETSLRDGFVIRDEAYYRAVWQAFRGLAEPLIAEVDGEPVAAVFLFAFAGRAYYVYGMSRDSHREKMPTYFLQWEAIRWAKARGCTVYDLWGAPDVFDESDSMWGVFRFKDGLGGQVIRTLGAWDFAPNSFWYAMYTRVMPMVLDVMRARGRARTRQGLSA